MSTLRSELDVPSEASILQRMLEFRIAEIHTAMPGVVTAYSPERNTWTVAAAPSSLCGSSGKASSASAINGPISG